MESVAYKFWKSEETPVICTELSYTFNSELQG